MKDDTCITYICSPYRTFDNCIIRTHKKDDTCLTYIQFTERSTTVSFERTKKMIHVLLTFTLHSIRQLYHSNAHKRWYMSYLHSPYRTFDNCIIRTHKKDDTCLTYIRFAERSTTVSFEYTICKLGDICRQLRPPQWRYTHKTKVVHWDKLNTMTMKLPTHNKEQLAKNALSQTTRVRWVFISYPDEVYSIQHYVKSDLRQVCGFLRLLRFPPPITLTATV